MTTLDFSDTIVEELITHHIGNKSLEEENNLSQEITIVDDYDTRRYLLTYFLGSFKPIDFQQFTHAVGLDQNTIYSLVDPIFDDAASLIANSQKIAGHLFESSTHPKVKAGELNVVRFSGIRIDNQTVDGIGIYKSESQVPFLQMVQNPDRYLIDHDFGFDLMSMDKGCLVINTKRSEGYRVLIIDRKSKKLEAQYWTNDFLQIRPTGDEYNLTKEFLRMTKDFVQFELGEEKGMPKTDQIDLLNRTVDYFKANETFEPSSFATEVFQNAAVVEDFRTYEQEARDVSSTRESFGISPEAVKNQSGIFKSVLKLDKNFHIYIHGNRDLIERGMDENGRKYYKIFYTEES